MKITETNNNYIYIVQASLEPSKCKIGITNYLDRRLKEYNNITGKSQENIYQYLFTCEVSNMRQVENDVKEEFSFLRERKNKEIYAYTDGIFEKVVEFIKSHKLFIKEIFVKTEEPKFITKVVKKTSSSLVEQGISRKDILQKAKKVKNDEFYTRYEDVEKEIEMYDREIWKDKVVFCNCDDAVDSKKDERKTSAFALYFLNNFKELDLKKIICTHYNGGIDLFNQGSKSYVFTWIFTTDGFEDVTEYPKGFDGSFDHPESIRILNEEADIVCTNPPFSRARDYWKILIESGKKFLIISNFTNAITPAFIPYFKENKVWAGYNRVDWYQTPKRQITDATGHWYTNFPIQDRPKYKNMKIVPLKEIPDKYKKYDDSKTLIVDNNYIPTNYKKPFAVSVYPILSGILEKGYKIILDTKNIQYVPYINGKRKFGRVLIQKMEE